MAEVLVLPQTQEGAAPPPDDYTLRYSDLAPPEVAAEPAVTPPPPSQAPSEADFRARYADLSPTPATDEVAPLPPPPEDVPDFQARYADLDIDQNVPATAAAVAETPLVPALPDHSAEWNAEQQAMAKQAAAAGLPPAPSGNARLADAIKRSHEAGYKFPHFTGAFDPTGDRTVTLDMEALVESLQKQEADATDPALKQKIAREKNYWAGEIQSHGMTAEQWKQQTGEPEPVPEPPDLTAWLDKMQITDPKERALFQPDSKAFKGERLPWTMGLAKWIDKIARPFTGSKPGELGTLESIAERGTYVPEPEEPSFLHAGIPSIPPQEGKVAQVAAGIGNLPIGFANFLLSPGGAATATSIGMLPKIGQILAGAGFTADQVKSFFQAETLQDKVTTALGSALLGLGTALHIRGARGGEKTSAITKGKEPESVQTQPESRVARGETKETSVSDRLQPAAEVRAEEITPFDFRPALRTTEGIIEGEVGKTHADIYKAADDPVALRASDPEHVFLRGKEVLTRDQLEQAIGVRESEQLIELQKSSKPSAEQLVEPGAPSEPGIAAPAVEPGMVRLYHGAAKEAGQAGRDFTLNLDYAKGYAAKSEGEVYYVDVPEGKLKTHDEYGQPMTRVQVPDDIAAQAKRLMEPAAVPGAGGAMGAAGAEEKLATYEQRKFGKRLMSDEELVDSFKEDLGNQYYEPIPNNITFENAVALVNERGIPESIRIMKDMGNGLPFHLRSAMGQFMVKRMNAAIKNLGESPDATRLQNHAIDTAEWLMDFGTKLGQGVQSFAAWDRLSSEGKLIKVRQDAKKFGVELTEKQEADILKMSQEIEAKAEGMPRDEAVLKLNSYIANIKGFDAKDLPLGIYYANMLSGYNTHIVNALDTFLNVSSEVNGLAMTNPKAAMTIYGGLLRGFNRGRIDGLHALTQGRMATDQKYLDAPRLLEVAKFGQKGGVPIKVTGRTAAAMKAIAESKIAYPLNAWKYVGRLMSASDTVMYRAAQEARAALLAHRLAVSEGMKGNALHNRVNEILGLDKKTTRTFEEQARAEGYKGAKFKSRVAELSRLSRPEDINADAVEFASEASYNHDPHGVLGFFSDTAAKVTNKVPVLKTVIPFTRIVANVTNRGLNYSPYGFRRAFRGYSFEAPLQGEARQAMLMRATMGTAALGIILGANQTGVLQVHGAGPSDREKRRQMLNRGWKPYSFQIGDQYFSYLPTPVGLEMSVMGNMIDSYRYNELGQKDAFTRAGYAFSRLGSTVFSQSFLNGTSTLFGALSGSPGETIASIKQFISSTAGTFLSPKIANDIYRLFDPKQYRAETIVGDLLRNTPMSAVLNQPTLNAFGEPVTLPNNRFVSKASQDPIWQFVARTGIRISVPSRTTTVPDGEGGKRRITPEEYYTYLQDSGQQLKTYISDNMDSLEGMEKEDLQDKLSEEAKAIRKRVKGELFQ